VMDIRKILTFAMRKIASKNFRENNTEALVKTQIIIH